jgi:hypothetical protein
MSKYYVYAGTADLGKEPLGTSGKSIWHDLKTNKGAYRRALKLYGANFRLYSFTNFYDNSTFKEILDV